MELQFTGEYGAFDYVAGLYWFDEEGRNSQDPTIFLGGPGDFLLSQKVDSQAIYGNVGYHLSDALRVSGGPALHAGRQDRGHQHQLRPDHRERVARLVGVELGPVGEPTS